MKILIGTAILCLLASAPAYCQQDQDNKQESAPKAADKADKPADKPPAKEPAGKPPEKPVDKPAKPPEKPPVQTQQAPPPQDQQQRDEHAGQPKDQPRQQPQQRPEAQPAQQPRGDNRVQAGNPPQANAGGRRIPEDRFRANFGRAHTFHVRREDHGRFQFGGFWFAYTDPWPADWTDSDDFYVDEIDGVYYLCDVRFPQERIVVVIAT
jgi:hypothetical protein